MPVPVFTPGTDAGRVCPKALHDAEPIKHTQPFTGEMGQGDRDNKSEVYFKNRLFLQPVAGSKEPACKPLSAQKEKQHLL